MKRKYKNENEKERRKNIKGCEILRLKAQKTLAEEHQKGTTLIQILKILYFITFQMHHEVKHIEPETVPCIDINDQLDYV